jgi:hypothetical protein
MTNCGYTSESFKYLISAHNNKVCDRINAINGKIYCVQMKCISQYDKLYTHPDHVFNLINNGDNWILMDSYIDKNVIRYTIVDISDLNQRLDILTNKFDMRIWNELTGGTISDLYDGKVEIRVMESSYDISQISNRFLELIHTAQRSVESSSFSSLCLLNSMADRTKSDLYLESLNELVEKTSKYHNLWFI